MAPDPEAAEMVRSFVTGEYAQVVAAVAVATGDRDRSEDAVQDALVKVLSDGHRPDRLGAWVTVVACNHVRAAHRRRASEIRALHRISERGSHEVAREVAGQVTLEAAVSQLPERQREIVLMYYYLDTPVFDIAAALDVSEGTVKTQLHRARAHLASALGKDAS